MTHQAVEDYTRVVAKDNDDKMQLRAKANTNIYRAHASTVWDLIHQVEKAANEGTFHTVVLQGLPLLLAELDPHLLYQTLSDRAKQSHTTVYHHRPVAINSGDLSLTSLIRRLASPYALWPQRVAPCLFVRRLWTQSSMDPSANGTIPLYSATQGARLNHTQKSFCVLISWTRPPHAQGAPAASSVQPSWPCLRTCSTYP